MYISRLVFDNPWIYATQLCSKVACNVISYSEILYAQYRTSLVYIANLFEICRHLCNLVEKLWREWHLLWHIDPLGQPTLTAGSHHCFRACFRPYVLSHFSKYRLKIVIATGRDCESGRVDHDDTCLVVYCFWNKFLPFNITPWIWYLNNIVISSRDNHISMQGPRITFNIILHNSSWDAIIITVILSVTKNSRFVIHSPKCIRASTFIITGKRVQTGESLRVQIEPLTWCLNEMRQESLMIHSAIPQSRLAVIFAWFWNFGTDGPDNIGENSDYYRVWVGRVDQLFPLLKWFLDI